MTTARRRSSARRQLAVQQRLHELAQWCLLDLERRQADTEQRQRALDRFLDEGRPIGRALLDALVHRRRTLAEEAAKLKGAAEAQTVRTRDEARRVKLIERLCRTLDEQHRRDAERRDLAELIDRLAGREGGQRG